MGGGVGENLRRETAELLRDRDQNFVRVGAAEITADIVVISIEECSKMWSRFVVVAKPIEPLALVVESAQMFKYCISFSTIANDYQGVLFIGVPQQRLQLPGVFTRFGFRV